DAQHSFRRAGGSHRAKRLQVGVRIRFPSPDVPHDLHSQQRGLGSDWREGGGVGMSTRYIARSPKIAARKLGDEMIVMSAVDSSLYTLNEVAAAIWQAADGRTPLETIVNDQVCEQFEISAADALRDAEEFVSQLSTHGIS